MSKVITFEFDKETKNTRRYNEVPEEGHGPVIGTLYLQKWAVKDAQTVTVTIEA